MSKEKTATELKSSLSRLNLSTAFLNFSDHHEKSQFLIFLTFYIYIYIKKGESEKSILIFGRTKPLFEKKSFFLNRNIIIGEKKSGKLIQ